MKLISFIVLCTLAAAVKGAISKEAVETVRTLSNECLKEIGATDAVFDEMIKNLPATNMEVKCLRACLMKKVNVLTPDGKLNKENALKMAEMHTEGDAEKMKIAHAVADACEAISIPDDHCEAAEAYKMCILSEAKKHGVNGLI
ncbi:general odorant-binding protein 28a-like [Episyrphus balteatus]|uniref:general odorant-binding protein 28a-like n=1 Tax=Episyrphus balteatus TaxID=286459 RepID=UPI002485CC47|nr:general odorant-binding protein 28a-like [Episyrphus balteatus]